MKMQILMLVLTATSAIGQQFYLRWDAKDKIYGPFEARDGTRIQIEQAVFTVLTEPPTNAPASVAPAKTSSAAFENAMRTVSPPVSFTYGQAQIKIHYGRNVYFVIDRNKDGATPEYFGILDYPIEVNGKLALNNKYFASGGQTIEVLKSTSDPAIAEFRDDQLWIRSAGDVVVNFDVGQKRVSVPLRIVPLPLKQGMTKDQVVKVMGLPAKTTKKYISWPDSEYVDGVLYSTSDNPPGRSVEHWHYSKYPGAILQMESDYIGLLSCHNEGWTGMSFLKYRLERAEEKAPTRGSSVR